MLKPQKHFLIPIRKEQYTSQNAWLTFIAQDPLRLKSLTAQFLKEDLKITLDFKNLKGEFPSRVKLFLAEKDTIVNNQKAFLFCQKRAKRCEQVVYPNTVHTLEFETCRDQYFKDLGDWILDEQG